MKPKYIPRTANELGYGIDAHDRMYGLSLDNENKMYGLYTELNEHQPSDLEKAAFEAGFKVASMLVDLAAHHYTPEPYRDAAYLLRRYAVEGVTLQEIAAECDVNTETVRYWMIEHRIPRRKQGPKGKHGRG